MEPQNPDYLQDTEAVFTSARFVRLVSKTTVTLAVMEPR